MTEDERRIWDAAFATCFVAGFRAEVSDQLRRGVSHAFDEAATHITAEASITVADLAIVRLREWRRDEDADAGKRLDTFHARQEEES